MLVEDHAVLAQALTRLLNDQGSHDVVAVAGSAETVEDQLLGLTVDLAIVDVSLPKMNGIELVSRLSRSHPNLPCIMLSGHAEAQYVNRSLAAGARGYVLKEDISGILEGIQEAIRGNIYVSKALRDSSIDASGKTTSPK
jgi:DNA-binding NarL/FixJ family response regulator